MTTKRSKLPWYKRDPSKFFAGTVGLGWEVKAIYGIVLDLIFDARGKLADDGPRIINYLGVGMSLQRWARARQELLDRGKLRLVDGFLTNDKMTRDLFLESSGSTEGGTTPPTTPPQTPEKTGQKISQDIPGLFLATDNGNNVLTTPATLEGSPVPARARERQTQTESKTSSGDVIVRVQEIARALGQDRGRYWEHDYRRMEEDGLEYGDILEAAKAHRGGHIRGLCAIAGLARSKREQRIAWRRTSTPAPEADKPIQVDDMSERDWENHLALLCKLGSWDAAKIGPPPTRIGHLVPPGPHARWLTIWRLQGEHPAQEADLGGNIVPFPSDRPSAFMRAMWQPIDEVKT